MRTDTRLLRHPLVRRDIFEIGAHIEATSGDPAAAERRMTEIDAAFEDILNNPRSGTRLDGTLDGYFVRHVGRDNKISIVFQHAQNTRTILIALVAFGGQNWLKIAETRL